MYKIAVLVSGEGTTLDNLAHHCYHDDGMVRGFIKIERVIADRECPALEIADKWRIPKIVSPPSDDLVAWSEGLFPEDDPDAVDLHVMAGWLRKVHVPQWAENKILNIHPSIDPKYSGQGMYGRKVHEAVVAAGESISGCTVHIVDNEYDNGEVIAQEQVAVLPWETVRDLEEAVKERERLLYPRAILNYLRQRST